MDGLNHECRTNFYILAKSCIRRSTISRACNNFLSEHNRVGTTTLRDNLRVAERNFFSDTRRTKHTAIIDLLLCRDDEQAAENISPINISLHTFSPLYFAKRLKLALPQCHLLFLGPDHIDYFRLLLSREIGDGFWILPHRNFNELCVLSILNIFETTAWRETQNPALTR